MSDWKWGGGSRQDIHVPFYEKKVYKQMRVKMQNALRKC